MLLRFVLLFAFASIVLMANQQNQVPTRCEPESEKRSPRQVKALVEKTEPIHAPCCADMLRISGTAVLAISVDPKGNVACVQMVSGHPLIIGVAIDSVRQWKFQPYTSEGVKKSFCGQVALRFQANEHGVKYKIV
jgi:outer membrane biosynthesis protein TonB